jgi:hypothetical protein
MSARNYNSIPIAPEVMRMETGELRVIRRRQAFDDILRDEV